MPHATAGNRRHRTLTVSVVIAALLLVWAAAAYLVIPMGWELYGHRHPVFDADPRITQTADGHPGDPLNVAAIGTEAELRRIMTDGGWRPAAALGLRSDLKIAADTVLSRPDDDAPVSRLFLFGREEDLAFEQPVGDSPRQRHHVRYWNTGRADADGRPMWIGAASFDERVGLSHTTGQITHHISPDVDAERDHLLEDLRRTGQLAKVYAVDDFHTVREGRNGGGDWWFTDGRLLVGIIASDQKRSGTARPLYQPDTEPARN